MRPAQSSARAGRGDVRGQLLVALLEGPAHGYEIMRRLEEASAGVWRASPGSVYPTLSLLADEGLLQVDEKAGKRTYTLTATGRAAADVAAAQPRPWTNQGDEAVTSARLELRDHTHQMHMAAKQVGVAGRLEHIEAAIAIVRSARQQLYLLLADD
jgi:DNA-binding PadR family transcriptional regulator